MIPAVPIIGFGALGAVFLAQSRFIDSWFATYGGPTRRERLELVFRDLPRYWSLVVRPPYTLKACFTSVQEPRVERRRRQLLIAFIGFPAAFLVVMVLTTLDLQPQPVAPLAAALAFLVVLYGLVLYPAPKVVEEVELKP